MRTAAAGFVLTVIIHPSSPRDVAHVRVVTFHFFLSTLLLKYLLRQTYAHVRVVAFIITRTENCLKWSLRTTLLATE